MSTEKAQEVLETAVQNQPKPKRGCRRGCSIFLLLAAIPFWWFCLHTTPLRISKETTYVTEPTTADRKRIDYFRAMEKIYYPPEMKTDNNGYRIFVRAFGDLPKRGKNIYNPDTKQTEYEYLSVEHCRQQVYEKLGLDPNIEPTLKIESPDKVLLQFRKENPDDDTEVKYQQKQDFWTVEEFPLLKDWLEKNTAGIDVLGESVRKPAFRVPLVRENENSIPSDFVPFAEVQVFREMARTVRGRARYRIGIGDIDGAIDDIITLHLLARHTSKQGTMIAALAGLAIDGIAFDIGIGSNPDYPPTKEQLERLVKEFDALPPMMTFAEILQSERLFVMANCQNMFFYAMTEKSVLPKSMIPTLRWSFDMNIFFAYFNRLFDSIEDGTFDEKSLVMSKNPFRYITVRSRTEQIACTLAALMVPAVQQAHNARSRNECTANMQRLTFALLLYEKDHGSFPGDDWQTAIRPYLGEKPEQYFRCPTFQHKLDNDQTMYALIRRDKSAPLTPMTILLVETDPPLKLTKGGGTIPPDPALFKSGHPGGCNVSCRNGAIRFISEKIEPEKLQSLLDGTATEILPAGFPPGAVRHNRP